jgi:hypothetical protein
VATNVSLVGTQGDTPTLNLIGIKTDGTVSNPVQPTDSITSLTIQPTSGLAFNDVYTLTLSPAIADADGRSLAPPNNINFSTFAPFELGSAASTVSVLTRPVVIGNYAYVGALVGGSSVLSGPDVINITDPANPQDLGIATSFVGRVTDAAGQANSPVAGGNGGGLLALSASFAEDDFIPSNIWLYAIYGSNPTQLTRVGAVSATSSATQAGVALRLSMLDQYLYASTFLQGLQVIDLNQALAEYAATPASQFGQAVSTEGDGFAMDTIVNTIPLPINIQGGTATEFDLKAAYFSTTGSGGAAGTQPLMVATGALPLVVADPFAGSNGVLYPPYTPPPPGSSVSTLSQVPLQMTSGSAAYSLTNGVAVDVGLIPVTVNGTTTNKQYAVVVGTGTANGSTAPLLAVVDISQPYTPGSRGPYTPGTPYLPQPVGFFQLSAGPTDVILDGTMALVGTGSNVLIVDLTNPAQPADGGVIAGSFGSRLALDGNGELIAAGSIPSTSVQIATLGSACAGYRSQILNGAPIANVTYPLQYLDWTIGSGLFSDAAQPEGFVLNNIALGGRYMATEMSLPYLVINRTANGPTTPAYMECQLYQGSGSSTGACTNSPTSRSQLLQFQFVNSNPNYFALQAQYLVDRLDGDPDVTPQVPDSCIVVTQDYEFWKEGFDACEASDVLSCARFKPKASYSYYTDSGPAINTVNTAQQFLFNPNPGYATPLPAPQVPAPPSPVSSVSMLMYDCEHSATAYALLPTAVQTLLTTLNPGAILDTSVACQVPGITANYGTNPLTTETAVRVIQNGLTASATNLLPTPSTGTLKFIRADNLHLRNTEDDSPIQEPQTNGNPGCPECVHIHWRWAELLEQDDLVGAAVVSPRFKNNGGYAIVPANSNQDVDIAIDEMNPAETGLDPSGQLWAGGAQVINQGAPLAFWYSGTGHSSNESFFEHGGFFSSLRVTIGNPTLYNIPLPLPIPVAPQELLCVAQGNTCPPVSSPITNNTGHTLQWVATFTDLNGNVIANTAAPNPNTGTITGSSGAATVSLPQGSGQPFLQTLILNIQVTDMTTQWSTQRQAYVTEVVTSIAP